MYCVEYNEHGDIVAIGYNLHGIEITKAEYDRLLVEIQEKDILVNSLYNGEITIDNVPEQWQEEIQRKVNELISIKGKVSEQKISYKEFYSMVENIL